MNKDAMNQYNNIFQPTQQYEYRTIQIKSCYRDPLAALHYPWLVSPVASKTERTTDSIPTACATSATL